MSQTKFFRSALGDVPTTEMGICYSHEHIIIEESYPTLKHPEFLLNDTTLVGQELSDFHAKGGRTVIDTMPANCGRNINKLVEVSKRSKVHIVVPTGIHLEMYYLPNHWRYHYSAEQLAQLFIDDIEKGIDIHDYSGPLVERSSHKAGLIKLATGDDPVTHHQEKIFEAVAMAHHETGAPILTHTNAGKHVLDQIRWFEKFKVDPKNVVICHVDRFKDISYHKEVLSTGVYLEYDSAFRWKTDENWTYKLLYELLPIYSTQIVMGMDMAKNIYWKSYGGRPGLNFLLDEIPKVLKEWGMDDYFSSMFITNPSNLYAFNK